MADHQFLNSGPDSELEFKCFYSSQPRGMPYGLLAPNASSLRSVTASDPKGCIGLGRGQHAEDPASARLSAKPRHARNKVAVPCISMCRQVVTPRRVPRR